MAWILDLYRSPVTKKAVMAVSGMGLFGFVLVHMLGNLKLYAAPEKINEYAVGLREFGAPFFGYGQFIWVARAGLLVMVLLHIVSAYQLTMINRRARPQGYKEMEYTKSTYASRTMRWGGVIIVLFIIYHLLHFTTGHLHPEFEHGEVYRNVVIGFQNVLVSAFYIVANIALGFHLFHGLWSMFQSLGWTGERWNVMRKGFAVAFSLLIAAVNISFPIAVLTGIISLP